MTIESPKQPAMDDSRNPELYFEIVKGQRVTLDSKPPEALLLAAMVAVVLTKAATKTKPGVPLFKPLIQLEPGESRRPDLAFFLLDISNVLKMKSVFDAPSKEMTVIPNLAIEMVGPNTTVGFLHDRTFRYLRAGVQLVWHFLIDLKRIHVFDSPKASSMLGEEDYLKGGKVLPDFSMRVSDVFALLNRPA